MQMDAGSCRDPAAMGDRPGCVRLSLTKTVIAAAFHSPARQRIQRRRAHRRAGVQIKTCVMQGTANRVADDQAVGQRALVVRAVRADGEESIARARQQHVVVADATREQAAVGQ